jgi:pSer/pThr/pTyr-binding forkhead associated (FHA) protein
MQVVLIMFRGEGEKRSFSVVRDITVIGRREDCDLRIPLGDVSRKHCRLVKENGTLRAEDLGSSNGTFQNGERIQSAELQAGDTLTVGPISFVVQIDGVPAEDQMLAPEQTAEAAVVESVEGFDAEDAPTQAFDEHQDTMEHAAATDDPFDPMNALTEDREDSSVEPAILDELAQALEETDPQQRDQT